MRRSPPPPKPADPVRELCVRISTGKEIRLVTNDLDAPAEEIAELYKQRWQIELFFKWIKQNLKIKQFLGTSENAVRTQIFAALISYLLTLRISWALVLASATFTYDGEPRPISERLPWMVVRSNHCREPPSRIWR